MSNTFSNNKRIAKNTLMLYIRMLFLMVVNLYTSRVILQALGVEDYGIYNAVAGFVTMFSMVSASMSCSISRFITFVLGQGDKEKLKRTFSTAMIIQLFFAVIVVILVEFFGVWFLNTQMNIPSGRETASNWVLQFALLTFVFNLCSTPYNATLVAHERMKVFAYFGIFEGVANLAISFVVSFSHSDRLIIYGLLLCSVSVVTRIAYNLYCKKHFEECTSGWLFDKSLFREMFGFAGWNFIGTLSGLLREHGINLLFNIFYGPVVNAARGLASQVNTAVTKFSQSFFMAVQPQITKSYSCNNVDESHTLVMRSSRLAFLLLTALIVPILSETDFILGLWLNVVPDHTVAFVRIILFIALFESFSSPLIHLLLSTGKIKKYQIVVGTFNLMNFPVAWIILLVGGTAEMAQVSVLAFSFFAIVLRLTMLKELTCFPVKQFFTSTMCRCLLILMACYIPTILTLNILPAGILRVFVNTITIEGIFLLFTFRFGLNSGEKKLIGSKIRSIFYR